MRYAAFTIVQNETYFLDIWVKYYRQFFRVSDLYILNHDTANKDALYTLSKHKSIGINVIDVHRDYSFDHNWLRDVVQSFQGFLLMSYNSVLFAEADELLITDPRIFPNGLTGLMRANDVFRCTGYNVIHYHKDEMAFNFETDPLLYQRKWWHRATNYDKTLISNRTLHWHVGFHTCMAQPVNTTDGLYLVHLHRLDYELCKARHREQAERKWSVPDLTLNRGQQNRIFEDDKFEKWFYSGTNLDVFDPVCYPIPDFIRLAV